jgi:hypothetical protein
MRVANKRILAHSSKITFVLGPLSENSTDGEYLDQMERRGPDLRIE